MVLNSLDLFRALLKRHLRGRKLYAREIDLLEHRMQDDQRLDPRDFEYLRGIFERQESKK